MMLLLNVMQNQLNAKNKGTGHIHVLELDDAIIPEGPNKTLWYHFSTKVSV